MKQHQCTYSKVCCCDILGMEPSEKCPVHSGYPEKPQCDICGRFINVQHQVTDHANDEYLAGLSDLDRARAIVAVRWLGAGLEWQERRRSLGLDPIDTGGHRGNDWGTNWRGTGSLMELAESRGWQPAVFQGLHTFAGPEIVGFRVELVETPVPLRGYPAEVRAEADMLHAAVLLACASAAMREDGHGK